MLGERDKQSVDFHHHAGLIEGSGPTPSSCTTPPARFQPDRAHNVENLLDGERWVEQVRQLVHRQTSSTHPQEDTP